MKFTVIGSGPFPADMLRYDECWPATENDAHAVVLETTGMRAKQSHRRVTLVTGKHGSPSGRWASFGWAIVLVGDHYGEIAFRPASVLIQGGTR